MVCAESVLASQAGVKSGQLASAVVGTINVLGTVVAASLMDKFGRKQLLSTSFTGMGLAMLSMAAGENQIPKAPSNIQCLRDKLLTPLSSHGLVSYLRNPDLPPRCL